MASTAAGQGQQVAREAADQAREVVVAARKQATQVTRELSTQARVLVEETRTKLEDEAGVQTRRLAGGLRRLGGEAQALAEGRPQEAGAVAGYVRQAADRLWSVADEIETKGPEGLSKSWKTSPGAGPAPS